MVQAGASEWLEMKHVWGANWCIVGGPLKGPFSIKLTTLSAGKTLSATDVVPRNWAPKATYTSRLNFSPVLWKLHIPIPTTMCVMFYFEEINRGWRLTVEDGNCNWVHPNPTGPAISLLTPCIVDLRVLCLVCVGECVGATVAISKGEIELGIVFGGVMFLFLSNSCHFLLLLWDIACYIIIWIFVTFSFLLWGHYYIMYHMTIQYI